MVGLRLNADTVAELVPVFHGQTLFLKPHPDPAFDTPAAGEQGPPLLYFVAPIRTGGSEPGEIVAAGAFGYPADDEFTKILSVARQGLTGETYAFDEHGLLLNESRFDDELRTDGLLPSDPRSQSILRIEIRDPGPQREKWRASSVEAAERPLTALAAKAIAAGRKGDHHEHEGVILDPYRNYRGRRVIGAWRWLPKYSMAVATEVAVSEQYAPMQYPLIAEWIRFGMLAGCVMLLLVAASWIVMLGRDAEEARQLGQYTLQEVVGKGGMGVVYRAQHALLKRPTAIKLLRPETMNAASMTRFEREAQLASQLTHPNTVEIFDLGRTPEGSFYCVMEFLDGRTLEEVRTGGRCPACQSRRQYTRTGRGLTERSARAWDGPSRHQAVQYHAVRAGRNPRFCQSAWTSGSLVPSSDRTTTSRAQASSRERHRTWRPNVSRDPTIIDKRSDLYSFGAVGYYLLTGRQVFHPEQEVDLIKQIMTESPPPPSEVTSNEIPSELEELILRCLAREMEDRPATIHEVLVKMVHINLELSRRGLTPESGR